MLRPIRFFGKPWQKEAFFILATAAWLACDFAARPAVASSWSVVYRGKVDLTPATTTDQNSTTFTISELSGVTYQDGNLFTAVSDDTASSRLVHLNVAFNGDASISSAAPAGGVKLANNRDHEGVVYTHAVRNSVFLSVEVSPGVGQLHEYSLVDGSLMQSVNLPSVFSNQADNRGMEALTRRPDGLEMWTANEEALTVDGGLSTNSDGSVVRLQRLAVAGNSVTTAEQYAYVTDPIHPHTLFFNDKRSGLVDLVSLPDGTLLTLERSAVAGLPTFVSAIYQVDFAGATDISQGALANGLISQSYTTVTKTQLFASSTIAANLEGLCLGPQLSSGNWVLLGVVDNGNLGSNALVAFELIPVPEPAGVWLALFGIISIPTFVIRRCARARKA